VLRSGGGTDGVGARQEVGFEVGERWVGKPFVDLAEREGCSVIDVASAAISERLRTNPTELGRVKC